MTPIISQCGTQILPNVIAKCVQSGKERLLQTLLELT